MAQQKFTVTLAAKIGAFIKNMKIANKSIKKMGMNNRGIIKSMQKMGKAGRNASKALQKSNKKTGLSFLKLAKRMKKAGKSASKFWKVMAVGGVAVAGLASAFILLRKALHQANLAAEMDVQAKAFANLVQSYGASSKKLLVDLKAASKQTLSLQEIMTTGSRALLLGIQQDKLVDLMKIARAASKAMGTTVSAAFSDISLGIGRQSRLILDNLGIIVRVGVAYDKYAQSIGTTADALTDFEKKSAFQNAVIEAGQDIITRSATGMEDFQDKMAQANAFLADTWAKLRSSFLGFALTIAEFAQESGFVEWFQSWAETMVDKEIPEYLESLADNFEAIGEALEDIKNKGLLAWFSEAIKGGVKGVARTKWDIFKAELMGDFSDSRSRTAVKRKPTGRARSAGGKLLPDMFPDDGTVATNISHLQPFETKDAQNIWKEWSNRLSKNIKKTLKVASGEADPTKSDLFLAEMGVKALDEAFKDVNVSAQDLQKQFAQTMPVIKRGFESLNGPTKAQVATMERLAVLQQKVADNAFVEGLGLETDAMFRKSASRDLAKVERLLKIGNITDPKAMLAATDKLLAKVRANVMWLTDDQKTKLKALNIQLSKIIPVDTIKMGLNQWVDDFNSATGRMSAIGKAMAETMATGFDNFLFDSVMGKITSLEDAFNNMFKSILRQVTKFVGNKATQEFMGLAFGATGNTTQSNLGIAGGLAGRMRGGVSRVGGFLGGLIGRGGSSSSGGGAPASVFRGAGGGGGGMLGGIGGIMSAVSGIGGLLGLADGGIANFAGGAGGGIHANPTLAAIAEKPGKKEAVMPLEKFTDLVQPVNINISTIDTKSFQQYMMDNKEIVLGTIMGIKGSRTVDGMQRQQRGPF